MSESPDDMVVDAEVVNDEVVDDDGQVAPVTFTDYTEDGVPTFDYVRDQIEGRIATSIGTAELTAETQPATSLDEQFAAREQAGRDRLAEIRRSMRGE
jgi:phage shock protein A